MPSRIGEPQRVGGSDQIPTWLVGLSEDLHPEWRHHFLRAARASGLFHGIKAGVAGIVFGIEPSALSLACEKIDDWIAQANRATSASATAPLAQRSVPVAPILRIDRPDGSGIDLSTVEYVVSLGDAEDEVGRVIVARPKGPDALIVFLRNFPVFPHAVETAIRVLTSQPSHVIHDVALTKHFLRSLGL
jgi:hypothetical protein